MPRQLRRTARRLSLTDEGQAFYSRSKENLPAIDEAGAKSSSKALEANGTAPLFRGADLGIYVVYGRRKRLPLKLRKLIDFLVEAFHAPRWTA